MEHSIAEVGEPIRMVGKNKKQLFPDVWWKSPNKEDNSGGVPREGGDENINTNGNDRNYGAISSTSYEPVASTADNGRDEEGPSLLDTIVPVNFPDCIIAANNGGNNKTQHQQQQSFGSIHVSEVPSDISNRSDSSVNDNSGEGSSSCYDSSSDDEYEDEIEQPHRTLGLIFFDFIRFIAISANVRCVNTQMMPVFLAWGKMDMLSVALR